MRVPVEMRPRPLFEVGAAIAPESCAEVGHGEWAPLLHATSSTLLAHLDNLRPATAELDVYVAAGEPLPVALGATFGPGTPVLSVEQFGWQPEQRERLAARLKADGLPMAGAFTNTRFATRLRVRVDDKGAFSTFFLLLGGIPQFVIGRGFVDAPARPRARLCGVLPAPLRLPDEGSNTEVYLGPGGDVYFGRGWGRALPTPAGNKREVTGQEAELLLPLEAAAALDVVMGVEGTTTAGTAELIVNGSSLGSRRYPVGWTTVTWPSASTVWHAGVNRVVLRVHAGTPLLVRRIELARADPGSVR